MRHHDPPYYTTTMTHHNTQRDKAMPTVMTTGQLATKLAVHENTLGRWRDEGMPHHAAGGKYIYEWREVSEWLESTDRGGYLILAGGVSEAEVFGDGS